VVLDGETDKLINNEDVKEFYLGMNEVGTRNRTATSSITSAANALS